MLSRMLRETMKWPARRWTLSYLNLLSLVRGKCAEQTNSNLTGRINYAVASRATKVQKSTLTQGCSEAKSQKKSTRLLPFVFNPSRRGAKWGREFQISNLEVISGRRLRT